MHDRSHKSPVELRLELFFAQIVVESVKLLYALALVVEDLDNLLPRYRLFDVTVNSAESCLLT